MMTKEKRKMVNVEPISNRARNRFVNNMDNLHGCHVEQEKDDLMFLASLNRKYFMWVPKTGNEHWRILK